ncbi:MAG: hypothetical protein K0Q91_732 [Fibrobacteria bacterium]|nr:hypothetical protein [Fibrobacteria bacterium]
MAYPENSSNHDPRSVPNRGIESEEDEMLHNDPVERPLPGRGQDALGESGDRDPLIENATGQGDESGGEDPAPSRSHDAEEDRVRPGDRKRGVE